MKQIYVSGLHGLGDSINIRAIMRRLIGDGYEVWLETSWPAVFYDMPTVHPIAKGTKLRTQLKNAAREADKFEQAPDAVMPRLTLGYTPAEVRAHGSVLAAMFAHIGMPFDKPDFSLPLKGAWLAKADALIASWNTRKPILFYRPLIERKEWGGCPARNPDRHAYADLLRTVQKDYFVVSIADIVPRVEWLAGDDIGADVEYHAGELDFETLAGLMYRSALCWTSPGFATILALSVGTPVVTVFGGYENSKSFFGDGYLGIDPVESCQCFSHHHACKKAIDIETARKRILEFTNATTKNQAAA